VVQIYNYQSPDRIHMAHPSREFRLSLGAGRVHENRKDSAVTAVDESHRIEVESTMSTLVTGLIWRIEVFILILRI